MRIVIMRHGKTAGNLRGACIGRTDEPLCAEGVAGARRTGCDASVGCVFVSPLQRARQTAELCFPQAEQVVCDDLHEMDFGDFEGKTHEEKSDDPRYLRWLDDWCESPCPNGESKAGFIERVMRGFLWCVSAAREAGEDEAVIVAHGGTVMAVMDTLASDGGRTYFDWRVANCEGFCLDVSCCDSADGEPQLALSSYVPFSSVAQASAFLGRGDDA